MTLRRRLLSSMTLYMICTVLLGTTALLGMHGMRSHFDAASDQYQELQVLYEVGHHTALARAGLRTQPQRVGDVDIALQHAALAATRLDAADNENALLDSLERATMHAGQPGDTLQAAAMLNAALAEVASRSAASKQAIVDNRTRAQDTLATTLVVVAVIFAIAILGTLIPSVFLYRSVMKPVRSLMQAIDRMARAEFHEPVSELGTVEMRRLIRQFNRMKTEIRDLHDTMNSEIATKSRQLIRSEELAGVGALAAGLAHEINNPLGIISGYAESTLRSLESDDLDATERPRDARVITALRTINDEAFRCAGITGELLRMARPGAIGNELVRIDSVAQRAVELARGLTAAQEHTIRLTILDNAEPVACRGDAAQLLQVMLNLIRNACESFESDNGTVLVSVHFGDSWSRIIVEDNGCGMDDSTVAHAFDPFFTRKAERAQNGVGLGLSISHSIIERHGGHLIATSPGLGHGSRFTIELPNATAEVQHHACA